MCIRDRYNNESWKTFPSRFVSAIVGRGERTESNQLILNGFIPPVIESIVIIPSSAQTAEELSTVVQICIWSGSVNVIVSGLQ